MCIIVDANRAAFVFGKPTHPEYAPILDWVQSRGCLVYGGKLARELFRIEASKRYLIALRRAGRARLIPDNVVDAEQERVEKLGLCKSDDPHVVALVRTSGARTVCTEDEALMKDLKKRKLVPSPPAKIYRTSAHRKLLSHCRGCPGWPERRK